MKYVYFHEIKINNICASNNKTKLYNLVVNYFDPFNAGYHIIVLSLTYIVLIFRYLSHFQKFNRLLYDYLNLIDYYIIIIILKENTYINLICQLFKEILKTT